MTIIQVQKLVGTGFFCVVIRMFLLIQECITQPKYRYRFVIYHQIAKQKKKISHVGVIL